MEANAALRNIVRRDTGEGYREMLEHLARESGIETPTAEDLARLDRKRKGKKLSNEDWVSKSDPEAKIAKMKDGTTHLAYKPEQFMNSTMIANFVSNPLFPDFIIANSIGQKRLRR